MVNRAKGGTITAYWVKHLAAVLSDVAPDAVLFYCGSNDLNAEVPDETIVVNVLKCRAAMPQVAFAYFSIIKAPQKHGKWERIDAINAAIAAQLSPSDLYVECNAVFFPESEPASHFFVEDGLHLNADAYDALAVYARPRLAAWMIRQVKG